MATSIDRIISNAVNGAQQGLFSARKNSAQLAAAGGGSGGSNENKDNTVQVEKASNSDMGKLVDVEV